jgi:hypothetical protein
MNMSDYIDDARNVLPNGLTLLQVNPDCAARLDPKARDHGWLYIKGADGQWVTHRKLSPHEIETAYDQSSDMKVLQGTKVRRA